MEAGKEGEKLVRKRARTHPDVRYYLRKKEEKSGDTLKLKKWLNDQDFGYAKKAFNEMEKLKTPEAKKTLFDTSLTWLKKTADYRFGKRAAEYLISLSTPEVRQPLVEYLFRFPEQYGRGGTKVGQGAKHKIFPYDEDPNFVENITRFKPLFMDYTPYILKLAGYKSYIASYQFYYPLEENISCIGELCKIDSPLSTNILWLAKGLKKIEVLDQVDQYARSSQKKLDFEPIKKIARKELERRGNPEYDPSAYLNDKNWVIR
ncbi:MAG: hypothetical protein JXB26_04655 [Candidatus Aminicenantes bacterium]|nr:hypothetical protein [Candidatus Aminicenantes bacterium]